MKTVAVLAHENTPLSALALPVDIFNAVDVFWNRLYGQKPVPRFSVRVASPDGRPIRCKNSVSITPDCAMQDLEKVDILFISPIIDIGSSFKRYQKSIEYICAAHATGTVVASICTGAFLLAASGLLDGKEATTHWGLAEYFSRRFPLVKLLPQRTVVEDGRLCSSGGANAGADLCLHLVRKFCGSESAYRCARALVLDPVRNSQAPYEVFHFDKNHGDREIAAVQHWLENNYHEEIGVISMARKAAMSRRTFERKFKNATGESPLSYLKKVRIESAKLMLETGSDTFEQITVRVGYGDPSSFRRAFQKNTGVTPAVYREKFRLVESV